MRVRTVGASLPDDLIVLFRRLGEDMAGARKARRMTQEDLAKRLNLSRKTVAAMEKGDPKVSFGSYAVAAWIMKLEAGLMDAFSPLTDPIYQREARFNQPKRVRKATGNAADLDF